MQARTAELSGGTGDDAWHVVAMNVHVETNVRFLIASFAGLALIPGYVL